MHRHTKYANQPRGITRQEEFYPDPNAFNPGRWLDPSSPVYREPLSQHPGLGGFSQFGFGRRTCQGIPIVEQDLFLTMAGMAWAFEIRKSRNPTTGTETRVHWNDYTPLLISKPRWFAFDAVPRDRDKVASIREMHVKARHYLEAEQAMGDMDVSQYEKELGDMIYFEDVSDEEALEDTMSEEDSRESRYEDDSWDNVGDGGCFEDEDEPLWEYLWARRRYFWEDRDWTWHGESWTDEDLKLWAYLRWKRRDDNSWEESWENRGEESPWEEDPYQNRHEALWKYLRGKREEDRPPVFIKEACGDKDEEFLYQGEEGACQEEEEEGVWVEVEEGEEEGEGVWVEEEEEEEEGEEGEGIWVEEEEEEDGSYGEDGPREEEGHYKEDIPCGSPWDSDYPWIPRGPWYDWDEELEEVDPCKEVSYDPAYWEYLCEHREEEPYATAYWECLWVNREEDSSEDEGAWEESEGAWQEEGPWEEEPYHKASSETRCQQDTCDSENQEDSWNNESRDDTWDNGSQQYTQDTMNQQGSRDNGNQEDSWDEDHREHLGANEEEYDHCEVEGDSSQHGNQDDGWEKVDQEDSLETPHQEDSCECADEDSCEVIEDCLEATDDTYSLLIVDEAGSGKRWAWVKGLGVSASKDGEASAWSMETVLGSVSDNDDGWEIETLTSGGLGGGADLTSGGPDVGAAGQCSGSCMRSRKKITGWIGDQRVTIYNPRVLFADNELGIQVFKGCVEALEGAVTQMSTEEESIISEGLQEWLDAVRVLPKGTAITTVPIPVGLEEWRGFMGPKTREGS